MYKYVAVDMYPTVFILVGRDIITSSMSLKRGNRRVRITRRIGHTITRNRTQNISGGGGGYGWCKMEHEFDKLTTSTNCVV